MDEDEPPQKSYPPSVSKMSKTPSWIMLGFVLGALFVLALPDRRPRPEMPAPARKPEPAAPAVPRDPPPLSRIEAVFEEWGKYAVWHEDTTEVALWDPAENRYSDFYEVRKVNGAPYFRSIPKLTRRAIDHGKPLEGSPLQFTETEEQYREWEERDRARRPLERIWKPPPTKPPLVQPPATPPITPAAAPQAERIKPPPWENIQKPAPPPPK